MIIEQEVYEVLPTGDYTATIVGIEPVDGQFGPQLRFDFMVSDGEHTGATLRSWASAKFSPRSKLYQWTRAAFRGNAIPPSYALNTDDLLNKRVVLSVIVETREDGSEFNKVQGVRPERKATPEEAPESPF